MFGMAIHPANRNIMIFGGDMGACYRTEDGGKTWRILGGDSADCPRATFHVAFHPKQPNVVWHLGSGVLKSTDGGKTWRNTHVPNGTYCALGLDPDNPDVAYVSEGQAPRMVLNWTHGKVLKTVDGGRTWQRLEMPYQAARKHGIKHPNFTNFIIDPDSPVLAGEGHARVYLFGRGGLYRSDDAGKTWRDLSETFAPGQINDMVRVRDHGKTRLFLTAAPAEGLEKGGVYQSTDEGVTWIPVNKGLERPLGELRKRNAKLKSNPETSIFALLLAHGAAASRRLYVGSWRGVFRSDDAGESWRELLSAEGCAYVKDQFGAYMAVPKRNSPFKTSIWGGIDAFNRMIAWGGNADVVAFSDNEDMYLSTDGGKTWAGVSFEYDGAFDPDLFPDLPPNRYTHRVIPRGPQNLVCDHVEIDPFDPRTYYAAYMDVGLQISRDGGHSWEHPTRGTPGRGHAWTVVADPGKKGRVFLTIGQAWGQRGGIYRSEDAGRTWNRIGLENARMGKLQSIAIDLSSPVNRRTLYLGSEKNGLYQSVDGGASWRCITPGFSGSAKNILSVVVSPASPQTVYAGTAAGLFVSRDAGASWSQLGKGVFEKVENLSVCRRHPSTLYLCAHYPGQSFYWGKAGFWRSDDGGKTFTDITPAIFTYAGAVAVNPFDPRYVYGCNNLLDPTDPKQKLRLLRSKDGGKTWENIGDSLNWNRARHLYIDQQDPRKIFVLTRFAIIAGVDTEAPTNSPRE